MALLSGQVALITGCARVTGLGREIARSLAAAGADVAVTDIDGGSVYAGGEDEGSAGLRGLASFVEELGRFGVRAHAAVGDVGDKADAERMVAETVETLGQVDVLVNNAAAAQGADQNWTWEVPEQAFDEVMHVNTKGVFLMSSAVVRHLIAREAGGRIVNISSGFGRQGRPRRAVYCASKFAVVGLTQSMAQELAPRGITVNAVCPGPMNTGRRVVAAAADVPVGRLGEPEEIARAVLFLTDPAAGYITGECINVNGGIIMV